MSDPTSRPRRYTDEEVRRLMERASELQYQEPPRESTGLTLEELEQIAREAGIDVDALRRAAGELEAEASGVAVQRAPAPGGALAPHDGGRRMAALAGAPLSVALERTLPVEVSRAGLEALIPILQGAADALGTSSIGGRTLSWRARHPTNLRELLVVVASRSGETRIRVEERYGNLAGTVFGSGVGGVGAGVGLGVGLGVGVAIGSALLMVGMPLVMLGGTYLGSRALYTGIVRGRRPELEQLISTLVEELSHGSAEANA